jgi:hypothetical protein
MAAAEDLLYLPEWSLEGLREVTETARRFREFSRWVAPAREANDLPLLRTRRFGLATSYAAGLSHADATDHRSNDDFAAYVPCEARSSGRRACDRGAKR